MADMKYQDKGYCVPSEADRRAVVHCWQYRYFFADACNILIRAPGQKAHVNATLPAKPIFIDECADTAGPDSSTENSYIYIWEKVVEHFDQI